MPCLSLIVEGDGDVDATPILVRRILHQYARFDVTLSRPKNAHGCGNLTKPDGLEKFVAYCLLDPNCDGILILMDSDDACPVDLARDFVRRLRIMHITVPVAVCFACREYEAWFVSSAEELVQSGLRIEPGFQYPASVDNVGNPKAWIESRTRHSGFYRETIDQARFTSRINMDRTATKSRSFRHLQSSVAALLAAMDAKQTSIIPNL